MRIVGRRWMWTLPGVLAIAGASITAVDAQRLWSGYYGRTPPRFATATTFDGSFNFCRVMFRSDRREKQGWATDYPGADINFSVRLAELTKVNVKVVNRRHEDETPDAVVVQLTDDALFQCPFTFMQDAGTARFTDEEVDRLSAVLVEGRIPAGQRLPRELGAASSSTRNSARFRGRGGGFRSSISRRLTTRFGERCFR